MRELRAGALLLLQFERFGTGGGIVHAISSRQGGVSTGQFATLNVSTSGGDDPEAVEENRRRILHALDLDPLELAMMGQVHETRCAVVLPRSGPSRRPYERRTDALVTNVPGTTLMALCADCAPVLLWDPMNRAIGVAHAGWRGALGGVVASTISTMVREYRSDPRRMQAAVGPCIGACCFEVREQVLEPLARAVPEPARFDHSTADGRHFLDLPELLRWQLRSVGVPDEQIELSGECTACATDRYYSHRAERGKTGRFGAFIALR